MSIRGISLECYRDVQNSIYNIAHLTWMRVIFTFFPLTKKMSSWDPDPNRVAVSAMVSFISLKFPVFCILQTVSYSNDPDCRCSGGGPSAERCVLQGPGVWNCPSSPQNTAIQQPHWGRIWWCAQVLWNHLEVFHKHRHQQPKNVINYFYVNGWIRFGADVFLFSLSKERTWLVHTCETLSGGLTRRDLWPQIKHTDDVPPSNYSQLGSCLEVRGRPAHWRNNVTFTSVLQYL